MKQGLYLDSRGFYPLYLIPLALHCKKGKRISLPSRDVSNQTSPCRGIIKLFPVRDSFVRDILAGDGKSLTFFYSVSKRSHVRNQVFFPVGSWPDIKL